MTVLQISAAVASPLVIQHHYLHRRPSISFAFGLIYDKVLLGVCTFGTPASRQTQISACKEKPESVIELNRLWVDDSMPRNTESWFVTRCLALLPPRIVISYADSAHGHVGYIYRALNFFFAGMTDEDRKTPRFDYVVSGKHSRDAFRSGDAAEVKNNADRVRRKPKYRYWTVTGNRRERRALMALCTWGKRQWPIARPSPP